MKRRPWVTEGCTGGVSFDTAMMAEQKGEPAPDRRIEWHLRSLSQLVDRRLGN